MKKDEVTAHFNEMIDKQPADIKNRAMQINKFLVDNGCKISSGGKGDFTYTSRKTDLRVCVMRMGDGNCTVFPYGRHFAYDENIIKYLPEEMLAVLTDGTNECTGCATKRPDLVNHNIRYAIGNSSYRRCHHKGFGFSLKDIEFDVIEKWLAMELAWV